MVDKKKYFLDLGTFSSHHTLKVWTLTLVIAQHSPYFALIEILKYIWICMRQIFQNLLEITLTLELWHTK